MNNTQMALKASALASIDFGHRRLLSCRPRHFSHCSAQAPEWFATRLILISPITTRTGSTVASPSTHPFCTGLGRKNTAAALRQARLALHGLELTPTLHHTACAFTQQAARHVLDTTRDWLRNCPSPEQMR
ncbi:hypothetical protein [Limnohabitans sp. Rim8]|uniref:hypothetical protein n=1 Tax=Limnohabitans sp. Rim8 TaxID=1100718 RepID=UPI0025FDB367|nr:hypothetical protein [Limnohabitans sp. Rim8]